MAVANTKSAKAAAQPVTKKVTRSKAAAKTTSTAKPSVRRTEKKATEAGSTADLDVMRREIEALAYKLWEERGCPQGSDLEDWSQAERQLLS